MLKVVLFGFSGRMGSAIAQRLYNDDSATLHGSVRRDSKGSDALIGFDADGHPIELELLLSSGDVAIDFSLPEAVEKHATLCAQSDLPYVCGVTALTEDTLGVLATLATSLPLLWAPNMSTAVNLCFGAVADIAARLPSGFSVRIHDIHHAAKKDAPSGTALEFGRQIQQATTGSEPVRIDYSSVREGHHPGEHHIMFSAGTDQIEVRHRAGARDEFAAGAIQAARWLSNQSDGLYNMLNALGITSSS